MHHVRILIYWKNSSQTYTAKVTSVLPVLLSAIRVSPPSEGPAHDGKEIGKDSVTYVYNQVCYPALVSMLATNYTEDSLSAFPRTSSRSRVVT